MASHTDGEAGASASGRAAAAVLPSEVGAVTPSESGLWLGDESWALDAAAMTAARITHRLRCNMRDEDAKRWMAEQWCPANTSLAGALELQALVVELQGGLQVEKTAEGTAQEPRGSGDALDCLPPPARHQAPRPPPRLDTEVDSGGIINAYLPLFDDDPFAREHAGPLLRAGARFIHDSLDVQGGLVYVHCEKGCSRSPSVVAQYLVEFRGLTLLEAAKLLKEQRCRVSPSGGFIDALAQNAWDLDTTRSKDSAASAAVLQTSAAEALTVFRRPWLADYRAGRIKLEKVSRIL